jgi:WD40 repeat protein
VRLLRGHKKAVYSLAFLPDGRLATGGLEGEVCLWDTTTGQRQLVRAKAGKVEWLAVAPDGFWLAWCGEHAIVNVTDLRDPGTVGHFHTQPADLSYPPRVEACAFSPDGQTLLCVGGGPYCLRVGTWEPVPWAEAWWGQRASTCLAFAPDSVTVATGGCLPERGGSGWTVCFWDTQTGISRPAFPAGHPFDADLTFVNLAWSPDGRLLAGLCLDELRVWVADGSEVLHRSRSNAGLLHALAFSPDGRLLATGGNDQVVTLRDTTTWAVRACFDWKIARVQDVAFSPDGCLLAAAGSRGKVVVWDVDV